MPALEYARTGPVRRALRHVVTWRPVAALSTRVLPRIDAFALRRTNGRTTFSAWLTGLPIVQLETTGARSGVTRIAQVMAVPDGEGMLVVGANFGGASDPAWVRNARAHPDVTVRQGERMLRLRATELHGAERDAAFARALAFNPGWLRFRARAGERSIPILRLAP